MPRHNAGVSRRTQHDQEDQRLKQRIVEVHQQSRGCYGSPRVAKELRASGERIATKLVFDEQVDKDLNCLLIILRSASSPKAREAIRSSGQERFFGPIETWMGGPNARVRARLIADIIMGVTIDRVISDDFDLDAEAREAFRVRLARTLQAAIEV